MAHTPGPWEAIGPYAGGGWNVSPAEGHQAIHVSNDQRNAEANARLIAAAPDLLAALQELNDCMCNGATLQRLSEVWPRARAAIAKAEGRG